MIRWFYRLPNIVQFITFMTLILAAGLILAWRLQITVVHNQALHRAQDTANMVEAVGDLSSAYNGFWVFKDPKKPGQVGDFLDHKILNPHMGEQAVDASASAASTSGAVKLPLAFNYSPAGLSDADIEAISKLGAFLRKNPALVQRELSDVVEKSDMKVKFRMTSDRFFNPKNAPTRFELAALETMRSGQQTTSEYWELKNGALLYARRLTAKPACMACHDTLERAPSVIQAKYANSSGFGYVEGGVAGVISVTVPLDEASMGSIIHTMDISSWTALGVLAALVMASMAWFVSVTGAASAMSRYMDKILKSRPGEKIERFALDRDEASSRNEFHHVSMGIKALHRALKVSQDARD